MTKNILCYCVACLTAVLALTACSQTVDSIFGHIPSIYENEMRGITAQAEQMTTDKTQVLSIMMSKSDSAFAVANTKSQDDMKSLIGKKVEYVMEKGISSEVVSDITIKDVSLPDLHRSSEGMESVTIAFDVKTGEGFLYYLLENDSCAVDLGSIQIPAPDEKGISHIETKIIAPNVPAKYQESCKRIRFITTGQFSDMRSTIDALQKNWRVAYKNEMNL